LNFAQPLFPCTKQQVKIFEALDSNTLGGGKKNPGDKRDPPLTNRVKHARYIGLMSGAMKTYNAYMSVKCERGLKYNAREERKVGKFVLAKYKRVVN